MEIKFLRFGVVVAVILTVLIALQVNVIFDGLTSGKFIAMLKPQIVLDQGCPWASLPPSIKEYISFNATAITKLNKEDMLELSDWYKEMARIYKEPITLKDNKDFPPNKKEVAK